MFFHFPGESRVRLVTCYLVEYSEGWDRPKLFHEGENSEGPGAESRLPDGPGCKLKRPKTAGKLQSPVDIAPIIVLSFFHLRRNDMKLKNSKITITWVVHRIEDIEQAT